MSSEGTFSRADVELMLKGQQQAFESCMKTYMDSVTSRVDGLLTSIVEVKTTLTSVLERVNTLAAKEENITTEIDTVKAAIVDIELKADYLENQSRRNNLRIDGVLEDSGETWEGTELKVKDLFVTSLGFSPSEATNIKVERAHRTGKNIPIHPSRAPGGSRQHTARSIVVKFQSFKDREAVLRRCKERRPPGLFVNEDFSKRILDIRRSFQSAIKQHKEAGRLAYLSYDKLVVRDLPQQRNPQRQQHHRQPSGVESVASS